MKKMLAIALKDTRMRFASRSEWLFFLILPIIFTLVLAGGTGGFGRRRVRLVVVDEAGSDLSAQLIAALGRSTTVRPDVLSRSEADSQFSERRVSAELVIPPEFDMAHMRAGPSGARATGAAQQHERARRLPGGDERGGSRLGSLVGIADSERGRGRAAEPFASDGDRQAYFDAALAAAQAEQAGAPDRLNAVRGATVRPGRIRPSAPTRRPAS